MGKFPLSAILVRVLGLTLLFAGSHARAEGSSTPGDIVIWYRASQDCPSGAAFVGRIQVDGRRARLAGVGDHVDYVITLESDGKVSGGRLERQTERGTIAISELRGGACSEVADALSLSLTLAVTPSSARPAAAAGPEPAASKPPRAQASEPPKAKGSRAPAETEPPVAPRWWVGGGLEGARGLSPSPSGGANLFVGYDWAAFSQKHPASLRIGPAFSYSRPSFEGLGDVNQWITTLGAEFCPLRFSTGAFGVAPCALGEVGLSVASSTRATSVTSVNFWSSMGPGLRGIAQLSSSLHLGLTFAMMVPFSRLEVVAGSEVLYRTSPIVFSLGADLSWAIQ